MLLKKFNVRCFDVALPNDVRSSYIHDSFDQHSDYCSVHKKYLYGIRPDDRFDPTNYKRSVECADDEHDGYGYIYVYSSN